MAAIVTAAAAPDCAAQSHSPLLHRHALESIFGFLSLHELDAASRVCHSWNAPVRSMAPLEAAVVLSVESREIAELLAEIPASSLFRHVGRLAFQTDSKVAVPTALMSDFAVHAGHLTELSGLTIGSRQPDAEVVAMRLPRKLTTLTLACARNASAELVHATLAAIGSLSALAHLTIVVPVSAHADFSLLHPLTTLRSLSIRVDDARNHDASFSLTQLDQIRAMAHLDRMLIVRLTLDHFRHLLRWPHQLRWADVCVPFGFSEEVCQLVSTLPLRRLGPGALTRQSLDILEPLASTLEDLQLNLIFVRDAAAEFAAFNRCVHLTTLNLVHSWLSEAQLISILQSMRSLRHLTLSDLAEVRSLSFLAASDVPMLHSLDLSRMWTVADSAQEVAFLRHQTQLAQLFLGDCVQLDEPTQRLLTPPSVWLPMLKSFDYTFDPCVSAA